jgi:TolB-like protein/Tfp pilus assembly protein PilF
MSSIIKGYEYDIFISYRQKDNKHDGWVTQFVDNLKGELESTFKEEISVYFDINPHDGLLETHDVDDSLKDKLKCLVFIPIISRTYCDPKSFAWEHEFKAFVDQASKDLFGLKVKLPGGNVANRVLPVRIYDLESSDIKLCESVLGGALRSVDLIYKSAGVNRPLSPSDNPEKNVNKTYYRDQINKVANSIKEIITAIGQPIQQKEEASNEVLKPRAVTQKNNKTKTIIATIIVIALSIAGYFIIPKHTKTEEQVEKSIAVLPFRNDSPNDSTTYFLNGVMEEILLNLQKISDFKRVLSRNSVEQFRNNAIKSTPEIGKKLGVNYIVEGSGQKYGNKFVLRVQLIAAYNDKHLWGKSYDREIQGTRDINNIQSEIAQSIASELKTIITPEEKQMIEKTPTANLTAYDFYQRGINELANYEIDNLNKAALEKAEDLFQKALKYDSTFAQSFAGLAKVYWKKHSSVTEYFSKSYLDSVLILCNRALSFDKDLAEAYSIKGDYYAEKESLNKAIDEYDKALSANPNNWEAYFGKGRIYSDDDILRSIQNYQKAAFLNHGLNLPDILRNIAYGYSSAGFIDKVYQYDLEALKLDGDSTTYFMSLAVGEKYRNNLEKAIGFLKRAYLIDTTNPGTALQLGHCYMFLNQFKETLKSYKNYVEILNARGTFTPIDMHRIGWAYSVNGHRKEAEYYFDKQLEYSKDLIRFNRAWGQKLYPYYDMAGVYAFTGKKEKAYECLKLFNQRQRMPLWVATWIKSDPLFNNIRNESKFQQIVKEIEAKYQAEHERVRKWLSEQGML